MEHTPFRAAAPPNARRAPAEAALTMPHQPRMESLSLDDSSRPPRIGITTSASEYEYGPLRGRIRQELHTRYVEAVSEAGGVPVILPMLLDDGAAVSTVAALVDDLDALVITGGQQRMRAHAAPGAFYGGDDTVISPMRSRMDELLLNQFMQARKPVLGICYGMQLINVALGGGIVEDWQTYVSGRAPYVAHHSEDEIAGAYAHDVSLTLGTRLCELLEPALGTEGVRVTSTHRRGIGNEHVAPSLVVAARAPDGCVEGIESANGLLLGVQWHPEQHMREEMGGIFDGLVKKAAAMRRSSEVTASTTSVLPALIIAVTAFTVGWISATLVRRRS